MKKRLKKLFIVVTLLTMIFTFSVRPKKADASIIGLTAAGIAAAASIPLSTVLLGMGGLAAVGAAIYYQDDIITVGQKMAGEIALKGLLTSDYVNESTGAVTLNGDLVDAAASGVKSLPATRTTTILDEYSMNIANASVSTYVSIGSQFKVPEITTDAAQVKIKINYMQEETSPQYPTWADPNGKVYFKIVSALTGATLYNALTTGSGSGNGNTGNYVATIDLQIPKELSGSDMDISFVGSQSYIRSWAQGVTIQNITTPTALTESNKTVENAPTTINDMQSYAYTNNVTNNTMMIDPAADMTGANVDDLYQSSYDNLNESILQTGILTKIWNGITNIPSSIAAAGLAASTAINANMDQLWQDAGAIWSGMGDTLTNIQTDVNAKIGAMQTAMSGGIDNIRIDIGTMMDNLSAGIDSFAAAAAANWASWGQLTLDGIDAGIGAITSGLSTAWTNTTTAIDTAATATTTAINTGIGTITDGLTTITDWITGFPAMFFSWFVPPDFSFLGPLITQATNDLENKFGTLPSLEDIGSAITIQEKSIYDIEITLMGRNYKIVPIALKPTIDWARPFLTAAVNLTSITFLIHRNKRELFK